jgi:hypothetical protein
MLRHISKLQPGLLGGCAAAFLALPTSVFAVVLTPGNTVALSGTTLAARPELAGTEIADQTLPYSFLDTATNETDSGTLFNAVIKETGLGTLDFIYAVTVGPNSSPVGAIRTTGFDGDTTDVDYRLDSIGSIGPSQANRFTGTESGDIDFSFEPTQVTAGESSYFTFVKTNATTYDTHGLTDISADFGAGDQGFSSQLATYAPVPEPSILGAAGLFAATCLRRRRRA